MERRNKRNVQIWKEGGRECDVERYGVSKEEREMYRNGNVIKTV